MKDDEVPQDQASSLQGQRKAMYSLDAEGRYHVTGSSGWEVEEIVLDQAIEQYQQLRSDCLQRLQQGDASPLEYYMYQQRMDLVVLAQSTGLPKWRVRRHLRPGRFASLKASLQARYAAALGLSVDVLLTPPVDTAP